MCMCVYVCENLCFLTDKKFTNNHTRILLHLFQPPLRIYPSVNEAKTNKDGSTTLDVLKKKNSSIFPFAVLPIPIHCCYAEKFIIKEIFNDEKSLTAPPPLQVNNSPHRPQPTKPVSKGRSQTTKPHKSQLSNPDQILTSPNITFFISLKKKKERTTSIS